MNILDFPWTLVTVCLPLAGAAVAAFIRTPRIAGHWTTSVSLAAFGLSFGPWIAFRLGATQNHWFAVDSVTAPMLPLVALLHLLTILATAKVKMNRMSLTGHLAGESLWLGTFAAAPSSPWILVTMLSLGTLPPLYELVQRSKPLRIYVFHMGIFIFLMVGGLALVQAESKQMGALLLLIAVLVRCGTLPAHLWVADLFEHATFGTALLFVTPLAGFYAGLRLVAPIAPTWMLQTVGIASLITAIYASGMALVQAEGRRFFAYIFLSHASLVLVGFELRTPLSLTGALSLWGAVALSLSGLGIALRAAESRFGRLTFDRYRGLYEQSPALAVGFLVSGLGTVGFPGTVGFIAAELLVDGAIDANPLAGVGLVIASTLNGIAILRAYFRIFTGGVHAASVPLSITTREWGAIFVLAALVLLGGLAPQLGVADRHAAATELLSHARANEQLDDSVTP